MDRTESETIQQLCTNRRAENFEQLKLWDKERAHRLMVHRKLIDEFDQSLQDKIGESTAYIDVVRQFLTDLLTQRIKYELQTVGSPQQRMKNNMAGRLVYKAYGKQLGTLYMLTNEQRGHKQLKHSLEVGLEKIERLLSESQREITELRTAIQVRVLQLQNSNQLTLEACQRVMGAFGKDRLSLRPFTSEQDLFRAEQQFMYQAYLQTETQRELGKSMGGYLEMVQNLEAKKLVLVKQVIGSYLEAMEEWAQNQEQLLPLRDILAKSTEHKYIQECYSPEELLSNPLMGDLCKLDHKHQKQITISHIKGFLKKLDFTYFEHITYLVLKEYHIFTKFKGKLHPVTAIMTADAFINIYPTDKKVSPDDDSQHSLYPNLGAWAKMDSSLQLNQEGDIGLWVGGKKMWIGEEWENSRGKIQLVFGSEDQREQFVEFTQKMTIN